jgi:hypothetical protein
MRKACLFISVFVLTLFSCQKEEMDLSYQISCQITDLAADMPAAGSTIFISGYDGKVFLWGDVIQFEEEIVLDEDGRFEFSYSKLFLNKKADNYDQYILITDRSIRFDRVRDRDTRNIVDSLEWNTNYDDLVLFHAFN